ncbi:SCO7613 C-terminal domain-containing membrane protein [Nocardioides ferulae]|uniref:SCO7613 C-terminal domain-containing membrane protein n=1 Tax=Nocardioides ferulae TaxID=2340821 RepID=UPI000EB3F2FD|nr:hypothetical protein [Nocardioides ferulae]
MARYADPTRCPDCHTPLPFDVATCPRCALPLRGPIAVSLLQTLSRADDLLVALRASGAPAVRAVAAGVAAGGDAATGGPRVSAATYEPFPASAPAAPAASARSRGLRGSSVPVVLLGLGALCLLVAAVIFLAVAWSWLGVAGRTTVLVALTATAAGLSAGLGRRGLRVAAESLSVVALGLLLLDLAGAASAGWVEIESLPAALRWGGAATLLAGVTLAAAVPARLHLPQVAAGLGLAVLGLGVLTGTDHPSVVVFAAALCSAAVGVGARYVRMTTLTVVAVGGAGLWWLGLLGRGLDRLEVGVTLQAWWLDGEAGELVGASLLAAAVAAAGLRHQPLPRVAGSVAALLATLTVAAPALDEGPDALALVALAVVAGWAPVTLVGRRHTVAWLAVGPLALATAALLPLLAEQLLAAAEGALALAGPWSSDWTLRVDPETTWAAPALLLPMAAALVAAGWAAGRLAGLRRTPWGPAGSVLLLAGLAVPALYPVPVALVAGLLAAAGAAAVGVALPREDDRGLLLALSGAGLLGLAGAAALPSAVLTLAAVALGSATAAVVAWRGRFPSATDLGGGAVAPLLAGLVWTVGEVAGIDADVRGVPLLVVVGLLAVAWPRPSVELGAAASGWVGAAVAVALSGDLHLSLAVHLTLAGALVTASALVNPGRRRLGWLGGLLLALASWVRLADLGVGQPEAYTLPSALALVAVGLVALHRDVTLPTQRALGAGLWLATLPSLLWTLDDPVSLRAVLLGIACLGLVLGGAALRWSAPVVSGGVVGALLVLRELAPWAAQTPQWVLIGAAGTALVVVGVTWEARARDLRRAAAYLGRLR